MPFRAPDAEARDTKEHREDASAASRALSVIVEPVGQSRGSASDEAVEEMPTADVVEAALADALTKASAAAQWDVVARLAGELEARRKARAGVVDLVAARAKRRGKP
jgi:hypothetical protein